MKTTTTEKMEELFNLLKNDSSFKRIIQEAANEAESEIDCGGNIALTINEDLLKEELDEFLMERLSSAFFDSALEYAQDFLIEAQENSG